VDSKADYSALSSTRSQKKKLKQTTRGDAYLKERLVICNDINTDGRARVTTDEERVLPED